jgi:ubiquinone/menaquinone biosynthesis C-methylase UbiE
MDEPMPSIAFKAMSLVFRLRDWLWPRDDILEEVDIKPGARVLDFGCGPGSYAVLVAKIVGEAGKVYALDIHPLALRKVENLASELGLSNVETIQSDCATGLLDKEVDTALLYDIFHMLGDKRGVLAELHRVLKDDGVLSFSDHHMKEKDILSGVTEGGLFELREKHRRTYRFAKEAQR